MLRRLITWSDVAMVGRSSSARCLGILAKKNWTFSAGFCLSWCVTLDVNGIRFLSWHLFCSKGFCWPSSTSLAHIIVLAEVWPSPPANNIAFLYPFQISLCLRFVLFPNAKFVWLANFVFERILSAEQTLIAPIVVSKERPPPLYHYSVIILVSNIFKFAFCLPTFKYGGW